MSQAVKNRRSFSLRLKLFRPIYLKYPKILFAIIDNEGEDYRNSSGL